VKHAYYIKLGGTAKFNIQNSSAFFVFFKERQMMSLKSHFLILSAVCALCLAGCNRGNQGEEHGKSSSGVAATVNGTPISNDTVDRFIAQGMGRGHADSPEARKAIIDQLSMQIPVSQEAIKKKLDETPEVNNEINLAKQSILANAFVQDYMKNNPVSDEALKAEYDKVKAQMSGTEYKARHILVGNEAQARDIIARLKVNVSQFDRLAKEKSLDTGSKNSGGELGWFDPRGMVPEFGAAVAKLEKGKFTLEPVKTQYGYHVILLEDVHAKEPPPLDQVKAQLAQKIQEQNLKKLVDDLMSKAKIEITAASAVAAAPKAE
jgi:peptidyl-prolyl cis-trans isomerase C